MRHGCVSNLLFGFLLLLAFGGSSYFWFTYFVKGRSLPTPNLIGKTVAEAPEEIGRDAAFFQVGVVAELEDRVPLSGRVCAAVVRPVRQPTAASRCPRQNG